LRLDHSFTTDRRGNNGDCALRKFWKQHCSEQKRLKTNGNYCKNHQKSVGKDEAGGSNPPSNSKKSIENFGFRCFFAAPAKTRSMVSFLMAQSSLSFPLSSIALVAAIKTTDLLRTLAHFRSGWYNRGRE
jgi:hypothetical protein